MAILKLRKLVSEVYEKGFIQKARSFFEISRRWKLP